MEHYIESLYLRHDNEDFFTVVLLPERNGKFPTVVCRSPYVKNTVDMAEDEIAREYYAKMSRWLDRGYAVLFQHCRGQGKSTGAFVPYVCEREDGLAFREWIRSQPFYNGEMFLLGYSYSSSLQYATAPFEKDVKGAVLEAQDCERYRLWYRNGQMRKGHANWHFGLYKDKCGLNKSFSMESFSELPLKGLSGRVLGDLAQDFEEMLEAPSPAHGFWNTRFGGADARDAVKNADIPILLTTGYNDFYVGGVFRMWEEMSEQTRRKSALLVSPYNHGDGYHKTYGLTFPCGKRSQFFGEDYQIDWFDSIRQSKPLAYEKGVITYYRVFEDRWESDFYKTPTELLSIPMGDGVASFEYDPTDPPTFREEGILAEELSGRADTVSICTLPFEKDVFVKGQMKMKLAVESDRPDTSFFVRISIKKGDYAYVLRHDITSLSYQYGEYLSGSVVELELFFDEYAFLIKAGECLRIDISSTNNACYVPHTNKKGEYYLQTETDKAKNKIYFSRSRLILPIESE